MGRKKLEIKKIEELSGRKNKFSKRCPGLIKKAYELSVLTVTDGVLITSNPSDDKLSYFSLIRPEDALLRYINMPDDARRNVLPNKDSLIDKLQNCKIQDDMAADEEICTEQENNSGPMTSGDDNQFNQHAELINYQYGVFRQKIHEINRFCHTVTADIADQLDYYDEMLKALTANMEQTDSYMEDLYGRAMRNNSIREGPSSSHQMMQPPEMILQQQYNEELNPASIHMQQLQRRPRSMQYTGELNLSPMVLPPGLIQTQAKSNRVQPSASLMPSQNNIWNSSYDAAGPSNYFQQQPFEEHGHDGNYMLDFAQQNDKPNNYHFPF